MYKLCARVIRVSVLLLNLYLYEVHCQRIVKDPEGDND